MKNCQRLDLQLQFEPIQTAKTMRNSSEANIAQEALYRAVSVFSHT